jgi:signal transduction histidine kinase/CheY-like chemotaxis protein
VTTRRPEVPGRDAENGTAPRDAEAGVRRGLTEAPSVAELREAILRRIMRAACIIGALAMGLAILFVRPFKTDAAIVGGVALAVVFASTLLPRRFGVLSILYPWVLTLTGSGLALTVGPKPEPFLFLCGGLFIGSLVLEKAQLWLLALTTLFVTLGAVDFSEEPFAPASRAAWLNGLTSMLSVALPASIAGRMLVKALATALEERTALVRDLLEESRVRESTARALEATRSQLTQAQKMELIGQMAGGIAHDMNNALTAIMGGASLLDEGAGEMREQIQEAAAHAAKLTHQLMVFSRRDTSQPRPIDLSTTIAEQLKALRRLLSSEIALNSELPNEPVPVIADPTHVLQVLLNLTSNAKDAMGTGGTLTIALRHEPGRREAVVSVNDTGAGIPEELLSKVFEPFFTTKPAGQGTGLGLANVQQLVAAMGGTVEVESTLGRGTSFRLKIPTTNAPLGSRLLEIPRRSERSGTVLVVDDDVRVRATVYMALERLGFKVLEASSPETADALLTSSGERIDLLLTDVVLGGGGGAKVIEVVRAKFPDVRVLVMSGYNDDETLRRGIARGAFPFIEKPFTAETLGLAVDDALAGKSG